MMQLTCPTFINTAQYPNNSNYISSTATASMATTTSTTVTTRLMDPKLIKRTHDLSLFISPFHLSSSRINNSSHTQHEDHCLESDQTLQLFPIRNEGDNGCSDDSIINQHKETEISASAMNAPNQFIEFLPLKNWLEYIILYNKQEFGMHVKWQVCLLGVGFCWKIALVFIVIDVMFQEIGGVIDTELNEVFSFKCIWTMLVSVYYRAY